MLVTARPSLAPGVFAAAAAPLTILVFSWLLVPWAGGPEVLSRLLGASGAFGPIVIISGLVELAFLSMMLCHLSVGRVAQVAVLLGVATLPWTVGLLGTEVIVGRAVAALSLVESADARDMLALSVGAAMAPRVLGAWTSAALLGGLGLGLGLAWTSGEPLSSRRGHATGLLFVGLAAFALAAIAVVGALEAFRLFELLTRLEHVPLAERTQVLSRAVDDIARLQPLRWGSIGLLVTLMVASLAWRTRRGGYAERGWMESGILLATVAALLVLDGHPLRSALQGARAAGLAPVLLPEGFEALRTTQAYAPRPLTARATPEGLTLKGGLHLAWSTSASTLAGPLSTALHSTDAGLAKPPLGITPEPLVPLLADARLSGAALQRLIEASIQAGAHSVELVGHQPNAADSAALARLEERFPFFSLLAGRPGTLRLLLPAALPSTAALSWRARFMGEGALRLSPAQGGASLTLSLHASPAEVPEVLAGTFVGLELSRDVSLKQLGAAVEVLGLAGASPVVMLGADSRVSQPGSGGTRTLERSSRRGLLSPELLHRVVEAQRHALEVLRKAEPPAQSSQMNSAIPTMTPRPSTTMMSSPSNLDDWGTFGTTSNIEGFTVGFSSTAGAATPELVGRSPEWVTTEASRSSRPSRASASTRFMWSM